MELIQTEERAGKPIDAGLSFLVPVEKTVKIQPPGMWGVVLWRRPSAVVVQHPDGTDDVLEIQDQTRTAVLTLLGFGLIASLLILLIGKMFSNSE